MLRRSGWVLLGALGCGPLVGQPEAGTSGSSSTTGGPGPMSGPDPTGSMSGPASTDPTSPSPTTTSTSTGVDTGTTEDTVHRPFILDPDGGGLAIECDLWEQDCPRGEKCMPWDNAGGNSWNATRCSPIDPDAKAVGEPCTVVGSGVSGLDDCVLGAMCWDVDAETNMGECVGFCQGSEANPTCADACDVCTISGSGVLILCLPTCDPIAQDCSEGEACYPENDTFICEPDASGEDGIAGDPCEYINVCDPGNFCANADSVPGCPGAVGCCAPFCDASAADGCDALLPGTSCVPWFEEGQAPEGCIATGIIGACLVPT